MKTSTIVNLTLPIIALFYRLLLKHKVFARYEIGGGLDLAQPCISLKGSPCLVDGLFRIVVKILPNLNLWVFRKPFKTIFLFSKI